jgi:hypothetical protein
MWNKRSNVNKRRILAHPLNQSNNLISARLFRKPRRKSNLLVFRIAAVPHCRRPGLAIGQRLSTFVSQITFNKNRECAECVAAKIDDLMAATIVEKRLR